MSSRGISHEEASCWKRLAARPFRCRRGDPFNLRFDTRGECEKAQALVNHYDRDNVAGPIFHIENNGEAQVFFLESFQCEYDANEGKWRIVDHRGDDSAIGNAWDD